MDKEVSRLILVIGGTGTQGGNVARELLHYGHSVRILTRDPSSPNAQDMAARGAELVQGDLADPSTLTLAMKDVSAIFSVQYADPYDLTIEPRNATNMLNAAKEAGVEQVVHTSVSGSNLLPRWDKHKYLLQTWENKFAIEENIRNGAFRYWTILHPSWFMENFIPPLSSIMAPELIKGILFGTMNENTPLKLNSGEDTAIFARAAFENPQKYHGLDINIASDELSMKEIAQTLSRALGKNIIYETISSEETMNRGMLEGTTYFMEWLEAVPGFGFELEATKKYGIALKSFVEWVDINKSRFE
ncbi:NmrA/HSCARG family protein [Paenibacillus qinlingensis]|uniref:Uncharacterized protein YbjT (DUF2867 family) n=1 Tax=Paenibacillus qinlingensis TaxID=1837343 RepID=A0ABU1P5F6_9BACL|nr:NmrA/HSCARG family protein [Paenibacillus qinlingensis]MDR6554968.1 uncharacterized protein YbjT (DUF2867 family) [Paenibacillus qinlingensis]